MTRRPRSAPYGAADRAGWAALVSAVRRHVRAARAGVASNSVSRMGSAAANAYRHCRLPPVWERQRDNPASELITLATNWWRLTGVEREQQRARLVELADRVSAEVGAGAGEPAPTDAPASRRERADIDG